MLNNLSGGNFGGKRLQFMGNSGKKCVGELLPLMLHILNFPQTNLYFF